MSTGRDPQIRAGAPGKNELARTRQPYRPQRAAWPRPGLDWCGERGADAPALSWPLRREQGHRERTDCPALSPCSLRDLPLLYDPTSHRSRIAHFYSVRRCTAPGGRSDARNRKGPQQLDCGPRCRHAQAGRLLHCRPTRSCSGRGSCSRGFPFARTAQESKACVVKVLNCHRPIGDHKDAFDDFGLRHSASATVSSYRLAGSANLHPNLFGG